MFRRVFWLLVGVGFGFGVSFWLMRFVRATADRYAPEKVSADVAGALRGFGTDLREAAREGREGMREREAELRTQLETRPGTARPPQ